MLSKEKPEKGTS